LFSAASQKLQNNGRGRLFLAKESSLLSFNALNSYFQDPREALIVSLKREVNILQQENNHLRQLLELADSDSGVSFPQENSASLMAQMGMDRTQGLPLDGRGEEVCRRLVRALKVVLVTSCSMAVKLFTHTSFIPWSRSRFLAKLVAV